VSGTYLLDANALIALLIADHEHHARAAAWLTTVDHIAICPTVEGAMFRFLIRAGESQATASAALAAVHSWRRCAFWEDSISYTTADLAHVVGHRQVTDAYLASLAASRGGRLATFDQALASARPGATELIP
jgi:toxin-antitoxin system PIN domain toxin